MTTLRTALANLLHSLATRIAPPGWKAPITPGAAGGPGPADI